MSNAQTQIEMYTLVEAPYKEAPSVSIFTTLENALNYMASTYLGEEDEFEQFCIEARENDGATMEFGDDTISLIKTEVLA